MTLTVTQLNTYIKSVLDSDINLKNVLVSGEISNFTNHYASGHLYFSLKDENSVIRAVMFSTSAGKLNFVPENGMKVIAKCRVSLFEKSGNYQLYVESLEPDGIGALYLAYEQLKSRLEQEGIFSNEIKRPLKRFPKKVGIATAKTGAAIRDMISILNRRYPLCEICFISVTVQGEGCHFETIEAIRKFNQMENPPDVIIIGRGGGSIEDLWGYNSEELAYEIRKSNIPVVSAVGHETDFTISDFAADLRAPTPSAAAELICPDKTELLSYINHLNIRIKNNVVDMVDKNIQKITSISQKKCLTSPFYVIDTYFEKLDFHNKNIRQAFKINYINSKNRLQNLASKLNALSPLNVLSRGYAVLYKDNKSIMSVKDINTNDYVTVKLADGEVGAMITEKKGGKNE